jgi:DNA-directed RNA polymerase specialized sigma24 family protein
MRLGIAILGVTCPLQNAESTGGFPVSDLDAVTEWMAKLGDRDNKAAQVVWDGYFQRLANFARRKLQDMPQRIADEEDIALSAMHSFCRGAAEGRFPQLNDRNDLWRLLVTIAARKVHSLSRKQHAEKRGGGTVRGESVFLRFDVDESMGIDQMLGRAPTPELANMVVEDSQRLLNTLGDETLQQVALLKLEGYTSEEIARKLNCVMRTVERKLERIREMWSQELAT